MKFTWLVRVHSSVNPMVFGNSRSNGTTDMGENVTRKPVSGFKSDGMVFFEEKNLKTVFGTSSLPKKGYIHFCRRMLRSLKNGHEHEK